MVRLKKLFWVGLIAASFSVVNANATNAAPATKASVAQTMPMTQGATENPSEGPRLLKVQYLENNSRALIPQIEGMNNVDIQTTINNNLKEAIVRSERSLQGNCEVSFYGDNLLGIHFWGSDSAQKEAHPNKIDKGIHIDLATGKIYKLEDLFKPGADFDKKIKEFCLSNDSQYRYSNGNRRDDWKYEDFAHSWTKETGSFILLGDSLIVYSIPGFQTGAIGGYRIPYSDLKDIIATDGELWNKIQGQKAHS